LNQAIQLNQVLTALINTPVEQDTEIVYQWKTARGAVAMEFVEESAAREWYTKRMNKPMASSMPALELYRVETTTVSTKL
jgi:hypothetical protein